MENSSRFNLEAAISGWRNSLTGSSISRESLLELEAHLRDSIASQQAKGHSEEDAFALASYRLGQANHLEEEYAKAHQERLWFERILWMLLGAQLFSFLTQISGVIRGLLSVPQIVAVNSGIPRDPFWVWGYALWIIQNVILAGLLIGALKLLQKRDGFSLRLIDALRNNPKKWCGIMVVASIALGMLSLFSSFLPMFVRDWMSAGVHQTRFEYANLFFAVVSHVMGSLLLPAVMFWFLRREQSARVGNA